MGGETVMVADFYDNVIVKLKQHLVKFLNCNGGTM
jgi:hypothetical protein